MGSDELEFLDIEKPRICHWDECPRCAELREREGLSDKRDEFYFVMEKLHQMILSRNKKMIMWNDKIDISRDVPLSRDILIQFWRIAAKGRGPYEGCVFEKFLEKGFTAINSYYPQTYFDVESYMSSEKLKKWTPYNIPEQSGKYTDRVLGGEACAWEYGNYENYPFYGCVTPPVIATFGDKLWGLGEIDYSKEYKNALAEFIFGSKDFAEIFTFTGDVIPPRSKSVLTYADTSEISHEAITSCIKRLKENSQCPVSDKYAELLTEIAKAVH